MGEMQISGIDLNKNPRVFGILVTYKRFEQLARYLDILCETAPWLSGLVLVDNAPQLTITGDCDPLVQAKIDAVYKNVSWRIDYVPSSFNGGPAGGLYLGFKTLQEQTNNPLTKNDWVVFFDDDDPPYDSKILEKLWDFTREASKRDEMVGACGLVGSPFNLRNGRLETLSREQLESSDYFLVDMIGGNQFPFYRWNALMEVEGTNPELFWGFDDLDLGLRLGSRGWKLYVSSKLFLEARNFFHTKKQLSVKKNVRIAPVAFMRSLQSLKNRNRQYSWRSYYRARNLIWILRQQGRTLTAIKTTLRLAYVQPLISFIVLLFSRPTSFYSSWREETMHRLHGVRDGWLGRLGKLRDPESNLIEP